MCLGVIMKHPVAILAAGALALTAGLLVTVKTADDANAATRFSTTSRVNTMKFAPRQNFKVQKFSTQKSFTKRKLIAPKKFIVTKHKFVPGKTKFKNVNLSKFPKSKFIPLPKGIKGPIGISSLGPKGFKGPIGLKKGPKLINVVGPVKLLPKGPKITLINNKNFTIWRGPRNIWWNGRLRSLVALSVLGGLTIGGTYYLADGYVPIAGPICHGITEEGCSLVWREVPTEDGDVIWQCVQFCPPPPGGTVTVAPPGATPTATTVAAADTRTAAAPVAATAMAQGCDLSIHAEPNFVGVNSEVTADQPLLSTYGWDKAIASINIKSGTWDFYSEENYGGEMIRLAPGQYPTLAQGWDKTINSLMCAQP